MHFEEDSNLRCIERSSKSQAILRIEGMEKLRYFEEVRKTVLVFWGANICHMNTRKAAITTPTPWFQRTTAPLTCCLGPEEKRAYIYDLTIKERKFQKAPSFVLKSWPTPEKYLLKRTLFQYLSVPPSCMMLKAW